MATLSPPVSPEPYHHNHEYERPAQNRQRAISSMSTVSANSRRSRESKRLELTESPNDKKRLHTKADPSRALAEATPAEVALGETTIEDLRAVSAKDDEGNTITEPDRSNPTRYRFERPLDTIRSFNAAAEGTSHRRSSYNSYNSRPVSQYGSEIGRGNRASYYGNGPSPMSPPRQRPGQGGYYRSASAYGFTQPGSVMEEPQEGQHYSHPQQRMRQPLQPYQNGGYQNGYQNGHQNGYQNGGHQQDSPVSAHTHQQSYETMTSGSDENSKSTNPSSLNSSFDQLHQIRKPDAYGYQQQQYHPNPYADELNFSHVSPQKSYDPHGMNGMNGMNGHHGMPSRQQYGGPVQAAPGPPPKEAAGYRPNNPRQPIKLDSGPSTMPPTTSLKKSDSNGEKRQSWLKRRFSRNKG